MNGFGAIIFPDHTKTLHQTCFAGSYFSAYKNVEEGIITYYDGLSVELSHMTLIDNGWGACMMLAKAEDPDLVKGTMFNMKIYASSPIEDCPVDPRTNTKLDCYCVNKYGMLLSYFSLEGKPPYPRSKILLPIRKIKTDALWGGVTNFHDIEFYNFVEKTTPCGAKQAILAMNEWGSDYYPQ